MEREGAALAGVHGHIPDFTGAELAAARLADLDVWRRATVVKANPDKAQLPVRVHSLRDGKLLYMAVPRLATPFYLLDPAVLTVAFEDAATRAGATDTAPMVAVARRLGMGDKFPANEESMCPAGPRRSKTPDQVLATCPHVRIPPDAFGRFNPMAGYARDRYAVCDNEHWIGQPPIGVKAQQRVCVDQAEPDGPDPEATDRRAGRNTTTSA